MNKQLENFDRTITEVFQQLNIKITIKHYQSNDHNDEYLCVNNCFDVYWNNENNNYDVLEIRRFGGGCWEPDFEDSELVLSSNNWNEIVMLLIKNEVDIILDNIDAQYENNCINGVFL